MLPPFNKNGLLPAYLDSPTKAETCSPYFVTMPHLCKALGGTDARKALLINLIKFRLEQNRCGFVGYQWIGGSFTESNKEPSDIDVITFRRLARPLPFHLEGLSENISNHEFVMSEYRIDNHYVRFEWSGEEIAEKSKHWYSLFSHQRQTGLWKGFIKVPMNPALDKAALKILN
jgi:hypothetical protein